MKKSLRAAGLAAALITFSPLAAPASAEDGAAPPKPAAGDPAPAAPAKEGEGAKAAEPAKEAARERKVDAKAQALLDAYAKLLHTPKSAGVKKFAMSGEADLGFGPDPIGMNSTWSEAAGLAVDVVIPKSLADALPPEMLDMAKSVTKDMLVDKLVRPLIDGALFEAPSYDLAWAESKDGQVVKMTPFAKKTTWDRLAVTFGADGLMTGMTGVPNVDPADPIAGMYAGVDVEFRMKHKKIGERHAVEEVSVTTPLGEIVATAAYFEGPNGLPLIRTLSTADATGQSRTTRFFDYVVDGKPVAGTEKKKPAEKTDAPAPAETPAEKAPDKAPDPAK